MISAGSPRSISKRAKASKGEVVNTPPKSQITASIINLLPMRTPFVKRLTWCPGGDQPCDGKSGFLSPYWRSLVFVMAGLRPGHPRLSCLNAAKTWMPGTRLHKAGHDELHGLL